MIFDSRVVRHGLQIFGSGERSRLQVYGRKVSNGYRGSKNHYQNEKMSTFLQFMIVFGMIKRPNTSLSVAIYKVVNLEDLIDFFKYH